ncbi:hypothetical protein PIROE2DRAFT_69579 [Piromyces sp. E2]|nr:hypothetical protein PIROE2DRAFT_69579 [Piromyces sp. E2]|eukprot:OUM61684.1 hypothetical protein PIROE2DRAFT_69579 [Piromyces sp. E2]
MNLDNTDVDTQSKVGNLPNEIHTKKILGRNRGSSVGQINKKLNTSNMYTSPTMSITSILTTPLTSPHHKHSHSGSSSINSNHSSIRYNIKNMLNKTESPRSSPNLKISHHRNFSGSIEDNNIKIEISDMDGEVGKGKTSSEGKSLNVRKGSFSNNSITHLENDITLSNLNNNTDKAMVSERKKFVNDKQKTNANTLKNRPSSKISVSSSNKDSASVHPSSSDIGSYSISNFRLKPKSSVLYQYDSNARAINNSNSTALNNNTPNNSSNYLSGNYLERSETAQIENETVQSINKNLIYHYELGMFKFCYKDNSPMSNSENKVCQNIKDHCPYFCTEKQISCINFNPSKEGKVFEDELVIEDSKDPEYSFCKLAEKSRFISLIYIFLFTINVVIAIVILCFTIKYHGTDRKNLKKKLIKRLSYISEHYTMSSKFKNSNLNLVSNSSNNVNNNSNNKNLPAIGFHRQYSEPESMDIDNDTDTVKSKPTYNNEPNNIFVSNRGKRYRSNSTHITYNLPSSTTHTDNNGNLSPPSSSPFMSTNTLEDQNKTTEENDKDILKKKRFLRILFALLIIISIVLGYIGIYYIFKWYKEHKHIDMTYKKDGGIGENISKDINIGVSLVLLSIVSIVNIVISIYIIVLLSIIHFSRSKTYWHNDADEDTYSQSCDSLRPSSIYSQNNYNPNNGYNPSTSNTYIP